MSEPSDAVWLPSGGLLSLVGVGRFGGFDVVPDGFGRVECGCVCRKECHDRPIPLCGRSGFHCFGPVGGQPVPDRRDRVSVEVVVPVGGGLDRRVGVVAVVFGLKHQRGLAAAGPVGQCSRHRDASRGESVPQHRGLATRRPGSGYRWVQPISASGLEESPGSPPPGPVFLRGCSTLASVSCSSEILGIRPARTAPSGASRPPADHAWCRFGAVCCETPNAKAASTCRSPRSDISTARSRRSRKAWKSRLAAPVLLSRACLLVDGENFGTPRSSSPQHKPCATTRPITGRSLIVGGVIWFGCRVAEATRLSVFCVLPPWSIDVLAFSGVGRLMFVFVVAALGCGGVGVGWW